MQVEMDDPQIPLLPSEPTEETEETSIPVFES